MKLPDKQWALLPLRLIIGFGFAAHGYAKLARGPDKFANILEGIGIPLPHIMAWVVTLIEFVGGVGVMAGAFVVSLTLPLAIVMITALITVHFQYGFSSIRLKALTASGAEFGPIGYEMNLLYIVGLLTLALSEPTRLSLDHWLKIRKHPGTDRARDDRRFKTRESD
jgi:putative oxidoreductase